MDRIALREMQLEVAVHQTERAARLRAVEAMVVVGYNPTPDDYRVYHCHTFVSGSEPLSIMEWLQSIGGLNGRNGERVARDAPDDGLSGTPTEH